MSEVMPASRALSVERIEHQRSAGMESRCHHLVTVGSGVETSDAMASLEGQVAITSRKDRISVMTDPIGQSVLKCKDNLALDQNNGLGHSVRMAELDEEQLYKAAFTERVKAARIATGMKQWQIAEAIGVPQDHYKHWEKSRLMPHHLIRRFCLVCRVDPDWLMTGRGAKPLKAPALVDTEPERPAPRVKRSKRSRAA